MNKRIRNISFIFLLLITFSFLYAQEKATANNIVVLNVVGAIGPATQDYIKRGLAIAKKERATALILRLNTPGGLESAMRGINEIILGSPLLIITYVAPSGARAASAGTFILYASHLAVMAPGTNVGAASPVSLSMPSEESDKKKINAHEKKATNDAAAYIRSLAELRGRNADWAEIAVRQAASLSAEGAKKLRVIDMIADNIPQLLQKIDGHDILILGHLQKIQTKNKRFNVITITPDWRYRFLSLITDPNIAYILMLIGIYGLFFELANPGLILPGVVGVISLLIALYAFQLMPINYVGLTLLLAGITFMVLEIFVSSFGLLGLGGVIAFVTGSIMLLDTRHTEYGIAWSLIFIMSIITILFFFLVIGLAIGSFRKKIVTGPEGFIGSEGIVINTEANQISVQVLGETWKAESETPLHPGQKIKVIAMRGLILTVEPLEKQRR